MDKADIIHKYTAEEARNLQAYGELPANARINQTAVDMAMDDGDEDEDAGFDFDDVSFRLFFYILFDLMSTHNKYFFFLLYRSKAKGHHHK